MGHKEGTGEVPVVSVIEYYYVRNDPSFFDTSVTLTVEGGPVSP